jgi:hypothetical protein
MIIKYIFLIIKIVSCFYEWKFEIYSQEGH